MDIKKQRNFLIIIFIIGLFLDQITKFIALKNGKIIQNESIITATRAQMIAMSILVVVMLLRYVLNNNVYIKLDTKIICILAISGICSNLIDRLWNEQTLVFINITKGICLNLAYIYILIAWVGMAVILTKNTMKIIKRNEIKNESKSK